AEAASRDLIRNRDQTRPLRGACACAADDVPTGAARRPAANQPRSAVGWQGDVHKRTGACARLIRNVRNTAHIAVRWRRAYATADISAAGRQRILECRAREENAVAAAGEHPTGLSLRQRTESCTASGGRAGGIHA